MGWVAPLMAVADGTMDCESVVVCGVLLDGHSWQVETAWSMQVFRTLLWRPPCHGGMGSLFGGHCRRYNYRTLSSDFSCQTVLFCVQFFCVVLIHAFRCNDDDDDDCEDVHTL